MNPIISIIICTYNREKYIAAAIDSMVKQSLNKNLFEVIVIDNNSTDDSKAIAIASQQTNSSYNISVISELNQGLSFARNRGAKEAKGTWVSYLDDDAIAEPDFLQITLDAINANPDYKAFGGKIFPLYVDGEPRWMNKYINAFVGHYDLGDNIMDFPNGKYPRGSNMTIALSAFEAIQGFNTDLGRKGNKGLASEEKDFFERFQLAGFKMQYTPSAIVHHVIERHRLTDAYYSNQAIGYGMSEAIRSKQRGASSWIKKAIELNAKFAIALILSLGYSLTAEFAKAKMLSKVQFWVIKGFWNSNYYLNN